MYWVSSAISETCFIAVITSDVAIVVWSVTKRKSRCPTETFNNTSPPSSFDLRRYFEVQSEVFLRLNLFGQLNYNFQAEFTASSILRRLGIRGFLFLVLGWSSMPG